MNTLYLVRHAKSSWKHPELSDLDRPLNRRGRQNAPMMAERLQQRKISLDRVITSPAMRAHTTASTLATGVGFPLEHIEVIRALYFEGIEAMMSIIQSSGPQLRNVMLVGHNPDMTHLLNSLVGHTTDNMPTCAIATICFRETWQEVDFGMGMLLDYDYPKKLN
jgi:phosphohistidine phosphatase